MISIIISTQNLFLLENLKANIDETIGVKYEIIAIKNHGTMSIGKAYNLGADNAKFDYLVFCHEDIHFHTENWGYKLIDYLNQSSISLVGILGNTIKTKYPAGVYSDIQQTNRINQLQRLPYHNKVHYYTNPYNERISQVATLDGMFLSTHKKKWMEKKFDTDVLIGFHGYDIDFSLSMGQLGKVVVVYDILIEHFSFGGNTTNWVDNQISIVNKWKNNLPISSIEVNKKELKKKEIEDLKQLILTLMKLRYKPFNLLRSAIIFYIKSPFSRFNLVIIKHFFIRK